MKIKKIISMLLLAAFLFAGILSLPALAMATPPRDIYSEEEMTVLKILNKERVMEGLSPLGMTVKLQEAADIRAKEVAVSFSHTRPDGTSCFTVLNQLGISSDTRGENAAWGHISAVGVMNAWMNSDAHRENILSAEYSHIGIGLDSTSYNWVLLLTGICKYNNMELIFSSSDVSYTAGKEIEDYGIIVALNCDKHGTAYLSLISEMCSGYNMNKTGEQTISVKYNDMSVHFTLDVEKPPESPSLTFTMDKAMLTISGIAPETSLEDLLKNLKNEEILVVDKDGNEITEGAFVGTGAKVALPGNEGNALDEYTVIVTGDVNGDGKLSASDARQALRASAGLEKLEGVYFNAANVNNSETLTASSARKILCVSARLELF